MRGAFNAVFIEGEAAGELMLYGRGAGGPPPPARCWATSSSRPGTCAAGRLDAARLAAGSRCASGPSRTLTSVFYLSIDVLDRPGVLAAVAAVFGEHGVSIRSMEQLGLGDEARLVFITHLARGGAVTETIEDLGRLDVVDRVGGVLRVVGSVGPGDEA